MRRFIFFQFFIACLFSALSANQLHVCTIASHQTKPLEQLLDSCQYHGVAIKVIGVGLPYPGNGQKLVYLKEFVSEIPDDEIVLMVDAYDVLILAPPEKILKTFLEMGVRCIYGAETACYPYRDLKERYPVSPTRFRYLNAGTVMAYAGYLKSMLQQIPIQAAAREQGQVTLFYMDHQEEIALDYQGRLFQSLHSVKAKHFNLDLKKRRVHCLITGFTPCIVHGHGADGKVNYQYLYDVLFNECK